MIHINDIDASFFVAWLGVFIFLVGGSVYVLRTLMPIFRKLETMLDDFNGKPARPGVPESKGIMQRMADIETKVNSMEARMQRQEMERKNRNV